mgnify:FL=1
MKQTQGDKYNSLHTFDIFKFREKLITHYYEGT